MKKLFSLIFIAVLLSGCQSHSNSNKSIQGTFAIVPEINSMFDCIDPAHEYYWGNLTNDGYHCYRLEKDERIVYE